MIELLELSNRWMKSMALGQLFWNLQQHSAVKGIVVDWFRGGSGKHPPWTHKAEHNP